MGLHLILLLGLLMLALPSASGADEFPSDFDPVLLREAVQLEVITVSGHAPRLEYRRTIETRPRILTPPSTGHSMDAPPLTPFGTCLHNEGRITRQRGGACGYFLPLAQGHDAINLLPFDIVEIEGRFTGTWEVAAADIAMDADEGNVPIGLVTDVNSVYLPLLPLAAPSSRADLRRMRKLAFILRSETGSIQISRISFKRTATKPSAVSKPSVWVWKLEPLLGREEVFISDLKTLGIGRIYLQVHPPLETYRSILTRARAASIEVFALDGEPGHVNKPDPLIDMAREVLLFNSRFPETPFAGFQIDVEPYLLPDFRMDTSSYAERYAQLLLCLKEALDGSIPLSVVLPFWFGEIAFEGTNLTAEAFRRADEVVVMAYRSDLDSIMTVAQEVLSYGEKAGIPVRVGLETTPIPDELQVAYTRVPENTEGAARFGGLFWKKTSSYRVGGEMLSFSNRLEDLPAILRRHPQFRSFNGWVIHSYESMDSLTRQALRTP